MKKLTKNVKIILVSVVSAVLVLGIVLGCIFGFKGNQNEPNNPGNEIALSWNEKVQLLGNEINNDLDTHSYDVILGVPYEGFINVNSSLYDISSNYFIIKDNFGNFIYYYYFSNLNGTFDCIKINELKTNGGFINDNASSYEIEYYSENYVVIYSLYDEGNFSYSILEVKENSIKEKYLFTSKLEENEQIILFNHLAFSNNFRYAYFSTKESLDEENYLITPYLIDIENSKEYIIDNFNSTDENPTSITIKDNSILILNDNTCHFYVLLNEKILSETIELESNVNLSSIEKISDKQFIISLYQEDNSKNLNSNSYYSKDTDRYISWIYKLLTINESEILISDYILGNKNSRLWFSNVSDTYNFYSVIEQIIDSNNKLVSMKTISYYYKDNSLLFKSTFEGENDLGNILYISNQNVLLKSNIIKISENADNETLFNFDSDNNILITTDIRKDIFPICVSNDDNVKIVFINMSGEIVYDGANIIYNDNPIEINGFYNNGLDYIISTSLGKYFKINTDNFELIEIENIYLEDETLKTLLDRNYECYFTLNNSQFDVYDFSNNLISQDVKTYEYIETECNKTLIQLKTEKQNIILNFSNDNNPNRLSYGQSIVENNNDDIESYDFNNKVTIHYYYPGGSCYWYSSATLWVHASLEIYSWDKIKSECSSNGWGYTNVDNYGWSFQGWASSSGNYDISYSSGSKLWSSTSNTDYYLYAVFKRSTTLYYISGTTRTSTTVYQNLCRTTYNNFSTSVSDLSYWSFAGFNTSDSASSPSYSGNSSYGPYYTTSPSAIRAVYSRSVTFNYNGNSDYGYSTTSGSTSSHSRTYYLCAGSSSNLYSSSTVGYNGFSKAGYYFVNWYSNYNGSYYSEGSSFSPYSSVSSSTSSFTFTAQWNGNIYSITLNKNNGTGGTSGPLYFRFGTHSYYTNSSLSSYISSISIPSRTGYSFDGYYYGSSFTEVYINSSGSFYWDDLCYDHAENFTLYAKWTANTYTIAFVANKPAATSNSVSLPSNFTATVGTGYTISAPTLAGYTFTGWTITNMNNSGDSSFYHNYGNSSSSYSSTTSTSLYGITSTWYRNLRSTSGTVTFTANWRANTYTIAFNANTPGNATNTVSLSPTSVTATYDSTTTFPTPSLTGWICDGWATTTSGSVTYNCGGNYMNLGSSQGQTVTVYAKWTPLTYNIVLNAGGGTLSDYGVASGSVGLSLSGTTFTATYDSVGIFSVSAQRTGYQFAGWSASNNSSSLRGYTVSPSYSSKNDSTQSVAVTTSIKNLRSSSGTVTLTALWTPITYTIRFETNRPSNASSVPTVSPSSVTATYNEDTTFPTPTLTGWTANGWSSTNSGSVDYNCGGNYSNLTTTKNSTVTVYAKWTQNVYKITFNVNQPAAATSSASVSPTSISATYEVYYTMPTPTLTGWTCSGWSKTSSGNKEFDAGKDYRNFVSENNGQIELFAYWTPNTYYITYNSNKPSTASGSINGTVADTLATYDSTVKLATNSYSLTGWTYLGWSANKNATSPTYTSGESLSKPNFTSKNNDTYTLYAIWRANTYNITLDANGGTLLNTASSSGLSFNGTTFTATYDVTGVFTNSIVRAGYMFSGWRISTQTGTANSLPANTSYPTLTSYYDSNRETSNEISVSTTILNLNPAQDGPVTLSAIWTAISYYVNISDAVSTGSTLANLSIPSDSAIENITLSNSIYVATYGLTGKFKVLTNRKGYEFNGWSCSSTNGDVTPSYTIVDDTNSQIIVTTDVTNLTTVYKSTVTLTEIWTPITYKIKLSGSNGVVNSTGSPTGLTFDELVYTATFDELGTFNVVSLRAGYMFFGFNISTKIGSANSVPTNTSYPNFTSYYVSYPDTADSISATTNVLNVSEIRDQEVTLSVNWIAITYNLVYNSGRPTSSVYLENSTYSPVGTTPNSQATYDSNSTFSVNAFTLIGWTYLGWSTSGATTSPSYMSGETTTTPLNLTTINGDNVTIYAIWRQNDYTITYILNNGSMKETGTYPENVKFDSWFVVSTPIRTGYTFKGYIISTFTTNNEKYYGISTSSVSIIANNITTITNPVDRDYYYKNLTSTDGGNINFEAIWQANTYRLEYDVSGDYSISGSVGKKSDSGLYPSIATYDISFTVSAPERLGYTFIGWNIENMDTACTHYYGSMTTTETSIDSTMETSYMNLRATDNNILVKFTALWRQNNYNISYNYNNGWEDETGSYPKQLTFDDWNTISNPIRIGYTFIGWTIADMSLTCTHYYGLSSDNYKTTNLAIITITDVNVTEFLNLHSEANATVIFNANWTPNVYKIAYALGSTGGALGTGIFPTSATYDVPVYIDAPSVYPFGYHFNGWSITGMSTECLHYYSKDGIDYTEVTGSAQIVPADTYNYMNLHSRTGAVVTLTAIWAPNVYNLEYILTDNKVGNGHFNTAQPTEAAFDNQFEVPNPVRTGYTFTGWCLSGLSDECLHYYSSENIEFESTNGGYFNPENPNEFVVLDESIFKNLHCETGAVVTLTANWVANSYTITYHYMPSDFETSSLNNTTINSSINMTETKVQTVVYDSNFTTMKMAKSSADPMGVVVPADVKIVYWIFYNAASGSYQVATIDGNGVPHPTHEKYLATGTEQVFSSYELWNDYDLFGADVHAYAVYSFVDINLSIYYADSIINYNYFSNYKLDPTVRGVKTYNDITLPERINGRPVLGYWISSNRYIDGEISTGSITEFVLNGVTYRATAGATIKWGYSSTQAQDQENPTFYLYAVYDNSFDNLYKTELVDGANAISIGTASLFEEGKTYRITIRGLEASNYYDYSYIKLAKDYNSTGTVNCAFDNIYSHQNSTTSNLANFEAVAETNTTMVITFTADSNCINFNLFMFYEHDNIELSYLDTVEILISEVVEEI